jgi:heptosyltransferase II
MNHPGRILIFHTAFIGDIVLTLPLVQALRAHLPASRIAFVATPLASGVLRNHPAIDEVISYDKKGRDRGLAGVIRLVRDLRRRRFDLAIVPHRSLRSALIPWLARTPRRVGFTTSAAPAFFTDKVRYRRERNEIGRDLDLLTPLGVPSPPESLPRLYPNEQDREIVQAMLDRREAGSAGFDASRMIAVAPGSVWNTKRWPADRFQSLCRMLIADGLSVVLIGGEKDAELCEKVSEGLEAERLLNSAGHLSLLQSAEMIRRCNATVSNDSAPMHLAVGVGTPVVAIFGATVPAFGFAPAGARDRIMGVEGLSCRPCGIHGGDVCPIGSFICMNGISPAEVHRAVRSILDAEERSA